MQRVLIIEDEKEMARGLKDIFEFEGYDAVVAPTGREGLRAAAGREVDCIILDLMLPDISGYEVCGEIRRQKRKTPILILTARGQDHDKIRGLEIGADDYLTKPFSVGELLARVKALLRRSQDFTQELSAFRIGANEVDVRHYAIRRGRLEFSLSHYEAELLKLLYVNANRPVGRDEILEKVWGLEQYPTNRTVDNFIVKIRKKIEDDYRNPKHILTIYGIGYQLSP